jgi:hypothetical protein
MLPGPLPVPSPFATALTPFAQFATPFGEVLTPFGGVRSPFLGRPLAPRRHPRALQRGLQ